MGESLTRYEVKVVGYDELKRAMRAAPKEFRSSTGKRLRQIGNQVRDALRAKAPNGTLRNAYHRPGNLRRGVRTKLDRNKLGVTIFSGATSPKTARYPKGYRYGKRLEFDPKYGGRFVWFYPTWDKEREAAVREFELVLKDVADVWQSTT